MSLVSSLFLALVLSSSSADINEQIRQAYASGDYPRVAELHISIIEQNGFHYGNGKSVLDALDRCGQSERALQLARGWAKPYNYPGGDAVLADALIRNQKFKESRKILRNLSNLQVKDTQAEQYLEDLIMKAAKKTYELTWQLGPDATEKLEKEWWAPPQKYANQRLISLSITGGKFGEEKRDEFGNKIVLVDPIQGQILQVKAMVELAPFSVREDLQSIKGEIPSDVLRFLKPSPGIDPSAAVVKTVSEPLLGLPMAKRLEAISLHANKKLVYRGDGVDGKDVSTTCITRGWGDCSAISMAVVAWLRAAGIPARMIRGHSAINGKQGQMKQHTIPEYYLPGLGWRDWDHLYPVFSSRDNFVRHGSFLDRQYDWKSPFVFFQWREFKPSEDPTKSPTIPWNGPFTYKLISRSISD